MDYTPNFSPTPIIMPEQYNQNQPQVPANPTMDSGAIDLNKCLYCSKKSTCNKYMVYLLERNTLSKEQPEIKQQPVREEGKNDQNAQQQIIQVINAMYQEIDSLNSKIKEISDKTDDQSRQIESVKKQSVQRKEPVSSVPIIVPPIKKVDQPARRVVTDYTTIVDKSQGAISEKEEPIIVEAKVEDKKDSELAVVEGNPDHILGEDGKTYEKKVNIFGVEKYKEVKPKK